VTGRAWIQWNLEDKDVVMPASKATDPLHANDPWAQSLPDSADEKEKAVLNNKSLHFNRRSDVPKCDLTKTQPLAVEEEGKDEVMQEGIGAESGGELVKILRSMGLHKTNKKIDETKKK
jgi:hypothetical protein